MLLNPVIPNPYTSLEGLVLIIMYEIAVFIIEFLLVTTTLRWRIQDPLYGRTALVIFAANLASFCLVPFLFLISLFVFFPHSFFPVYLILTFLIEYTVVASLFYGLKMLPEEKQLEVLLILLPLVLLYNTMTLFLGMFWPSRMWY